MIDDKDQMALALRKAFNNGRLKRMMFTLFDDGCAIGFATIRGDFHHHADEDGCYLGSPDTLFRLDYRNICEMRYDEMSDGVNITVLSNGGGRLEIDYYYKESDK